MKTVFDVMQVNYAEYSYFKQLKKAERVKFFFELYEAELIRSSGLNLTSFFESLREQFIQQESESIQSSKTELPEDAVEVMIDDENIMIESNSLRATRHIIYKFMESGYIIQRDKNMEKTFKRDKVTRYLRIFRIINQTDSICIN
jgi:hypothetical protein